MKLWVGYTPAILILGVLLLCPFTRADAECDITVTSMIRMTDVGPRVGERLWLSTFAVPEPDQPVALALAADVISVGLFGRTWRLSLISAIGLIAEAQGGVPDPCFPGSYRIELDTLPGIFLAGQSYEVMLSYRPDTGEVSLVLTDLDHDDIILSGFLYVQARTGSLPVTAATQPPAEALTASTSVFAVDSRHIEKTYRRTGELLLLAGSHVVMAERRWANRSAWSDELVFGVKRRPAELRGAFTLTLEETASGKAVSSRTSPADDGTARFNFGRMELPPGQYDAVLTYEEAQFRQEVDRLLWTLEAPVVTAALELPVSAWLAGVMSRNTVQAMLRISASQPVADVTIHGTCAQRVPELPQGDTMVPCIITIPPAVSAHQLEITISSNTAPLAPVSVVADWPLTVTTGRRDLLPGGLFQITLTSNQITGSTHELALTAVFSSPRGEGVCVPVQAVQRPGLRHAWVVEYAPQESGVWQYHICSGTAECTGAGMLTSGTFTIWQPSGSSVGIGPRPKPPYRVLFSNDTTNMLSTTSPYHQRGERLDPGMLAAAVNETADTGVDAHILQPGLGWIPWWPSEVYDDHYQWWEAKTGQPADDYGQYMLAGGDMVGLFIAEARQSGMDPIISLRLNDGHHLENAGTTNRASQFVARFYEDHPEYRIGTNPLGLSERVHNWAIPEVRGYKLNFIQELAENYDIAGLELDFMRHPILFRASEPPAARVETITGFVRTVRRWLDHTAKEGQHRWLAVRIPAQLAAHAPLGIDVLALMQVGVDIFTLSPYYYTDQQTDLAHIHQLAPDALLYLEMTHTTSVGARVAEGYDSFTFRRTTDEQFYTAGHLAYARGASGVSLFNFVYYREHGSDGRGPFNEPPFHVIAHLSDPQWLARQPQHYVLGNVWNPPGVQHRQVPVNAAVGTPVRFHLDLAAPEGGWSKGGVLRVQARDGLSDSLWTARLNGELLTPTAGVAEPYPAPYSAGLGEHGQYRAWLVPPHSLQEGPNQIEVTLMQGKATQLIWLDLAVQ